MTNPQQPVVENHSHVHVPSAGMEGIRILATVLLFGGAGAIAWQVAQGPNAEMAASGLSMMIVMMLRLSVGAGLLRLPSGKGGDEDEFAANREFAARLIGEYKRALNRANLPVMALVSALYAIGFLMLRAGVASALGIFGNVVIASGASAMVGALVAFPSLLRTMLDPLRRSGVVADRRTLGQPAPASQPVRVVRRVVKKVVTDTEGDQTNVG